jgi:hypothetical protein
VVYSAFLFFSFADDGLLFSLESLYAVLNLLIYLI